MIGFATRLPDDALAGKVFAANVTCATVSVPLPIASEFAAQFAPANAVNVASRGCDAACAAAADPAAS